MGYYKSWIQAKQCPFNLLWLCIRSLFMMGLFLLQAFAHAFELWIYLFLRHELIHIDFTVVTVLCQLILRFETIVTFLIG